MTPRPKKWWEDLPKDPNYNDGSDPEVKLAYQLRRKATSDEAAPPEEEPSPDEPEEEDDD